MDLSKLERWLPFKFRRKSKEERQSESARSEGRGVATASHASSHMSPMISSFSGPAQAFFKDPFFWDPFSHFRELDGWFGDFSPHRFQPTIDVVDEDDALCVTAELPGISKGDVQLQIEGDVLVIRGEKKHEEEKEEKGIYRGERYYGYFQRAIPLPAELDQSKAEAKFDNGVLKLRLPKLPQQQQSDAAKRIPIK